MPKQKRWQFATQTASSLIYILMSLALSSRVAGQTLNIFKNGETADADEINANFSLLDSQFKDLESRLSLGFDGSFQDIEVDCSSDSSALETVLAGVSKNAELALYVSGHCSVGSVRADRGQTIYVIGGNPALDKLVAYGGAWSPVFSTGYIYLANIGIVQSAGNRSGAYAWSGGHLYLSNVTIETPNSGEGAADSFYCVAAELGSTAYVSGLTCTSYSKGIGLIGASSARLRGDVNVTANGGSAIAAKDGSAYSADFVNLTAVGSPAFDLRDASSYRQQYGDANTTYNITGDINVAGGSVLHFDDPEQTNHPQPGTVSVEDSTVSLKGFTTANYVLERSTGSIIPHQSVSNLSVDARQSNFQLEARFTTRTTADLRNSTMRWSGDCQELYCLINSSFDCRGNSNLETDGGYYTGHKCLTFMS